MSYSLRLSDHAAQHAPVPAARAPAEGGEMLPSSATANALPVRENSGKGSQLRPILFIN